MHWLNEPKEWGLSEEGLWVRTETATDFWRETHYGFTRDSGHFYGRVVEGDFRAAIRFSGEYRDQYDQAGLMIRLDERNWIKTGVEFVDGAQLFSVVVTREFSDWSVLRLESGVSEVDLRLSREGDTVTVAYSVADRPEAMVRLAYLRPGGPATVGPMCCSPDGKGFVARFGPLEVSSPTS